MSYNAPRIDLSDTDLQPPSRTVVRDPEWFRTQEATRREQVAELLKQRPFTHSDEYHLSPGDIVSVRVRTVDETVSSSRLDSKGEAALPLVRRISLAGLTVQEAEEKLVQAYEKFYMQPEVELSVSEYRGRPVSILGTVERPGTYYLTRDQYSLIDALALAGGFKTDSSDRLILVPAKSAPVVVTQVNAPEAAVEGESIAPDPSEARPSTAVEDEILPDHDASLSEEADMLPAEYEMEPLYYLAHSDALEDVAETLVQEPESAVFARSLLSDSQTDDLKHDEIVGAETTPFTTFYEDEQEPLELVAAEIDESLYAEPMYAEHRAEFHQAPRAQLSDQTVSLKSASPVEIHSVQIYKEEITGDSLLAPISIAIRPGDSIVVPGQSKVQVLGEIEKPGSILLTEKMTVIGAIAAAGGKTFPSNGTAEVVRLNSDGTTVATLIDLDEASSDPSYDIRLQSGDIVRLPTSRSRYFLSFLGQALPRFLNFGAFYQLNRN